MFGLAVGIMNICGSAQTQLGMFINTVHGRRWTFMSDGMKLKYTKKSVLNMGTKIFPLISYHISLFPPIRYSCGTGHTNTHTTISSVQSV
jgi:hypothetical protein